MRRQFQRSHPFIDIVQTHILMCLDRPTLASLAGASSHLRSLSSNDALWHQICNHMWPSTTVPCVRHIISSLTSGHRSFYSNSYLCFYSLQLSPSSSSTTALQDVSLQTELISFVDLHYKDPLILSRVQRTETETGWFMSSPFRVDVFDPKETIQTDIKHACMEKNLSLSWIMVDLTRSTTANFATLWSVSVSNHWLAEDLHVQYTKVISHMQFAAMVTCRSEEGGEVHVKEVSFVVEDVEGRSLRGKEGLMILQDAMENRARRRRRRGDGDDEKERYDKYLAMKKEMIEKSRRKRGGWTWCVFSP